MLIRSDSSNPPDPKVILGVGIEKNIRRSIQVCDP